MEKRKCTEQPQNVLKRLIVRRALHTLRTYSWGLHFSPFYSITNSFQDIGFLKLGSIKMQRIIALEHFTIKRTLYPINTCTYARGRKFGPFVPRPSVFEIQGCGKSALYTLRTYHRGTNFGSDFEMYELGSRTLEKR